MTMTMNLTIWMTAALMLPAPAYAQTAATPSAAPAGPAAAKGDAPDKERVVCRRVEVTGSLVKRSRVCKPASEWAQIIDRGNDTARRIVETGLACAGGPLCNPQ